MPVPPRERRRIFENSVFSVYSDAIARDGIEVPDFLVVEPHGSRFGPVAGVAVVPVREGQILLLRHYRHPVSCHVLEVPRGLAERGEDAVDAALRELAEETGLDCSRAALFDLGIVLPEPGIIAGRIALFAALDCVPGPGLRNDEPGIDGRLWYPQREVRRMLHTGVLQDGTSCAALFRYFAALDEHRIVLPVPPPEG